MTNVFSIINNPLEQFQIVPIIPIKSGAVDISFTNSALMMTLATGFFVALSRSILIDGNGHLIPNRWQAMVEGIYSFIQVTNQELMLSWQPFHILYIISI